MRKRRVRAGERGAAAVEFAFILPLLIALIGGIIDFGFAFNAQIGLAHAAREGVRVEAIGTGDGVATAIAAYQPIGVTGTSATKVTCPNADSKARVTISTNYSFFFLPFADRSLQSEAVMRCGG